MELGFMDAQIADGFAANFNQGNDQKPKNMFQDEQTRANFINRYATMPVKGDEIKLDLFKINRKLDVKKLKTQLWNFIDPKIPKPE